MLCDVEHPRSLCHKPVSPTGAGPRVGEGVPRNHQVRRRTGQRVGRAYCAKKKEMEPCPGPGLPAWGLPAWPQLCSRHTAGGPFLPGQPAGKAGGDHPAKEALAPRRGQLWSHTPSILKCVGPQPIRMGSRVGRGHGGVKVSGTGGVTGTVRVLQGVKVMGVW